MNNKNLFNDCSSLPKVAMSFMNTVHCEELALVANLLLHLQAYTDPEIIDDLLEQWIKHTKIHFAREDKLMEEYHFPPYPVHQMEHQQAMQSIMLVQQNWLRERDVEALSNYIQQDWRQWLQQHISTMDKVTAHFLSQFDIAVKL